MLKVIPVDGEKHYNQPGLSHGFIHFSNPATKECIGFCGTDYFDKNAIKLKGVT